MTLTKQKITREIGRRTRLRNADVARTVETLIDLIAEELARGGRIELENFMVLEVRTTTRRATFDGRLLTYASLKARPGKKLRILLNQSNPLKR